MTGFLMRKIKSAFTYGLITTTIAAGSLALGTQAFAEDGPAGSAGDQVKHFRQLGPESLPTPNIFRNAAGAPGPAYWQQQANVNIDGHSMKIKNASSHLWKLIMSITPLIV